VKQPVEQLLGRDVGIEQHRTRVAAVP
jgi:hypothetical protein